MLKYNNQRFNEGYFKKIMRLMEENRFEEAISEFDQYIKIYPRDLASYLYCACAYMNIGDFYLAEKILEMVAITDRTPDKVKELLIKLKIDLLGFQQQYKKCLDLLNENIDVYKKNDWDYSGILLYLKKQLDILSSDDYKIAGDIYLLNQIISYNEENAINHIKKHTLSSDNDNIVKFVEDFPLNDVYSQLRSSVLLENSNKIYTEITSNKHFFKYEANGHVGSKLVDYFVVVTVKDTDEIITMYPYENNERRECIDLTPVVKELPNQKRLSQIDKFNQRYSKK